MPKQQLYSRPWRAIHDVWLSSDRLSRASSDAIVLWHMLISKQDDKGRFPWTPVMVRSLTAIRDWDFRRATYLRDELARLGSVTIDGLWVVVRRGAELNGTPKVGGENWMIPRLYPDDNQEPNTVITQLELSYKPDKQERKGEELKGKEGKEKGASPLNPKGANAPNPLVSQTMKELETLRGYPSPSYAAEAAAVKWMLDHQYAAPDLIACYSYLKQEPFWQTKPLRMTSVKTNIAEWIAAGRLAAPLPGVTRASVNGATQRSSRVDKLPDRSEYGKAGQW